MKFRFKGKSRSTKTGAKITRASKGSGANRVYASVTEEPSSSESSTPSEFSYDNASSGSGGNGGVMVAMFILMAIVLTERFFKPLWNSLWNKDPLALQINPWFVVGMVIFILVMNQIATINGTANAIIWTMVIGMYIVFFVFNAKILQDMSNSLLNIEPPKTQIGDNKQNS